MEGIFQSMMERKDGVMEEIATCGRCRQQIWTIHRDRIVCKHCGNTIHSDGEFKERSGVDVYLPDIKVMWKFGGKEY